MSKKSKAVKLDFTVPADEHLMTEREAAAFLCLSRKSLQKYRVTGGGPTYRRLGPRRIAYLRADLLAWSASRAHTSTSAEGYRRSLADTRKRGLKSREACRA